MLNKDNEELFNNLYLQSNNIQKKKEIIKEKKKPNSKVNNNFQKITGSGSINTSGSNPIVVFKKTSIKKSTGDITPVYSKNTIQKSKNEYISDGGLSKKIHKFNNNNNSNSNINNIYFNNYINEKNQQLPNNKNIKNNSENTNSNNNTKKNKSQQILSKTVREFNKRPAISKTEKSKEFGNAKNNIDFKKSKNKSVNQNLNTNNIIKNNKKNKMPNNEDSKIQEEKKMTIMKKLVENGVVNEIKKLNNKKKSTQKERNEERKREILESHGLPIDLSDEEEEKNDSKKNLSNKSNEEKSKNSENNNVNILNKKFMSKTSRGFYPKINNYMFPQEDNHNFNSEEKTNVLRAKKLKPSVNPLEYIIKINYEKRKLNFYSDDAPQNININHSNNIFQKRKIKSLNNELNDSFRHQNIEKKKENNNFNKNTKLQSKSYNNEILKKSIDDFKDEFPFAHRKNHRTSEELKRFVKEKRIKNKKKEDDILLEKNKKLFLLFKNLYNLNMKDFSKASPAATSQYFYVKTPRPNAVSTRGKPAVLPLKNNINNYLVQNKNEPNSNNNIRKKKK